MQSKKFDVIHFVYALPPLKKSGIVNRIKQNIRLDTANKLADFEWPCPVPAPLSISYNIIPALNKLGKLKLYNITDTADVILGDNDIFIGHPWPDVTTKQQDSNTWKSYDPNQITNKVILKYPLDKRVFTLSPFNFDEGQVAWAFPLTEKLQTYIGICGDVWADNFDQYFGKKHFNNFLHVNMAITGKDYPYLKKAFNPKGYRRFLYIGRASDEKGLQQMIELKKRYPAFDGATIGCKIEGWVCLAEWADLNESFMREVAKSYDVILSFSTMDAQATTILEAMSWGFMIACTKETGYLHSSVFPLRLNDIDQNIDILNTIQQMDEQLLKTLQQQNLSLVKNKYNWKTFADKVSSFVLHKN